MIKPIKIPIKLKRINLRNRYWQNQDYHLRDYLHTVRYQMQIDINKSFRRELFRKLIHIHRYLPRNFRNGPQLFFQSLYF